MSKHKKQVEAETLKDSHLCNSCINSPYLLGDVNDSVFCLVIHDFFTGERIYCKHYKATQTTILDLAKNEFIKTHFILCSVKGGGK